MSMTGLDVFDSTIHKTHTWLKDIMDELQWENRHEAYIALRAVLHTLRDRLTIEEAAQLGAQLPMLIRGIYFEGWVPRGMPLKLGKEEFVTSVQQGLSNVVTDSDPERITRGVFKALSKRISEGEIEDVKQLMPKELTQLWPNS